MHEVSYTDHNNYKIQSTINIDGIEELENVIAELNDIHEVWVDKEAEKLYKSVDIYITEINEFIQLGYIVTYHDNYLIHEKVVTGMRRENNKLLIYLDGNEHCKGKIIYTKNPRVYYCTENWFEESFKVQIPFKVARKTFLIRKGEGNE